MLLAENYDRVTLKTSTMQINSNMWAVQKCQVWVYLYRPYREMGLFTLVCSLLIFLAPRIFFTKITINLWTLSEYFLAGLWFLRVYFISIFCCGSCVHISNKVAVVKALPFWEKKTRTKCVYDNWGIWEEKCEGKCFRESQGLVVRMWEFFPCGVQNFA